MNDDRIKYWLKKSSNVEPDVYLDSTEASMIEDSVDALIHLGEEGLSHQSIKQAHEMLMNDKVEDSGRYRNTNVYVGNYKAPESNKVKHLMSELLERNPDTHQEIYQFHLDFEKIHPFIDGNGRIGRIIYLDQCLEKGIKPITFGQSNRQHYYHTLRIVDDVPGERINQGGRGL